MKKTILLLLLTICTQIALAQQVAINNFLVKENLLKNSKLAIIAADSLNNPLENITGTYTFVVSGFTQNLTFTEGVAILPLQIEKSTFVYIKHRNEIGNHSKLIYVYKKDGDLTPYTIPGWWLMVFPVVLIVLALAFRKFIIIAVFLILIFIYFNHSNGLSFSTFFETIFDTLKKIF